MIRFLLLTILALGFSSYSLAGDYDQFQFSVSGDCSDIHSVWFHYLYAWNPAILGKDSQQRDVQAWLGVQLFQDGTYWAEYGEDALTTGKSGLPEFHPLFRKSALVGTWTVQADKLVLSGLGDGSMVNYTNDNGDTVAAVQFVLTQKIHDSRAVNQAMTLVMSPTNLGPKGISAEEYCAQKKH